MPDLSILIPHYHSANGNRALAATLPHLIKHTTLSYELIVTAHHEREFIAWNSMATRAASEWLVFMVSDQFVAPGWDIALWTARGRDTLAMLTVVESGYCPTPDFALTRDFGMTPDTFDAAGFCDYAAQRPEAPDVESWAFPWLIHRSAFWEAGGFELDRLSGNLTDMFFWRRFQEYGGKALRVPGYSYHLAAWTLTGEAR